MRHDPGDELRDHTLDRVRDIIGNEIADEARRCWPQVFRTAQGKHECIEVAAQDALTCLERKARAGEKVDSTFGFFLSIVKDYAAKDIKCPRFDATPLRRAPEPKPHYVNAATYYADKGWVDQRKDKKPEPERKYFTLERYAKEHGWDDEAINAAKEMDKPTGAPSVAESAPMPDAAPTHPGGLFPLKKTNPWFDAVERIGLDIEALTVAGADRGTVLASVLEQLKSRPEGQSPVVGDLQLIAKGLVSHAFGGAPTALRRFHSSMYKAMTRLRSLDDQPAR